MTITPDARRWGILALLGQTGFADVSTLQDRFNCSKATIRRDLEWLQRAGRVKRTHGGAVAAMQQEVRFRAKLGVMAEAKQQIAVSAAELVRAGMAVGFTGGTTTQLVARQLVHKEKLTVVTNALTVAMELATSSHTVIVTGGELRGHTCELVGPLAEPSAGQIHLDVVFVGVDGISEQAGITTHDPQEARISRVLMGRSKKVIVVADNTKLGRSTFSQIAPIESVDELVTDSQAPREVVEMLGFAGVKVTTA